MVSYQEWTSIAFEVAKAKGLQTAQPGGQRTLAGGRSFSKNNPNAEAIQVFARLWNDHPIDGMTEAEARAFARDEIQIV